MRLQRFVNCRTFCRGLPGSSAGIVTSDHSVTIFLRLISSSSWCSSSIKFLSPKTVRTFLGITLISVEVSSWATSLLCLSKNSAKPWMLSSVSCSRLTSRTIRRNVSCDTASSWSHPQSVIILDSSFLLGKWPISIRVCFKRDFGSEFVNSEGKNALLLGSKPLLGFILMSLWAIILFTSPSVSRTAPGPRAPLAKKRLLAARFKHAKASARCTWERCSRPRTSPASTILTWEELFAIGRKKWLSCRSGRKHRDG
mmetsp:Transcript_16487/g.28600  ORF Transcript_16487/g.28600 Transcript_16487/m.28600 type:complete len:255 (+) Transcript_16487:444-1208(+)